MNVNLERTAKKGLHLIEYAGLVVITLATLVAGVQEVLKMVRAMEVTLADLLLLFIYLEVIAMVALYLESGKLPVRMPIYIAIVALARYLALDMKDMESWEVIAVSGAIFVLTAAVLMLRYGQIRFPYPRGSRRLPPAAGRGGRHDRPAVAGREAATEKTGHRRG